MHIKKKIIARRIKEQTQKQKNVLTLTPYDPAESPYCMHNHKVNQFAQSSPDNLATTLIFVVATILRAWPIVVDKFPYLMAFIHAHNGMYRKDEPRSKIPIPPPDATPEQKEKYDRIPASQEEMELLALAAGKQGVPQAIHFIWRRRDEIYQQVIGPLNAFNNAQTIEDREAAAKEIYKTFLNYPFLGYPKAGFATQLVIGEFGCIDSINMQVLPSDVKEKYKPLFDKEGKFVSADKIAGTETDLPQYKRATGKRGVTTDRADLYVDLMRDLEKYLGAGSISKILWDAWCDMVGYKILNPSSPAFNIAGIYSGEVKAEKGYGREGSKKFVNKFASNIPEPKPQNIAEPVSRHHYELVKGAEKKLVTPDDVDYADLVNDPELYKDFEKKMQARNKNIREAIIKKVLQTLVESGKLKLSEQKIPALKEAIRKFLTETSTMAGGNVEGGMTKPPFGSDTTSMIEKHKKPKGTSLAGHMTEKKKLAIKKKLSEKMNPATDPRYPVAHTAGLGRAGTGATGLEEELDEDVVVEYLTEAEAKKKNPPLGKVTRNPSGSKKKFHVYVRCGGKVKKISFGDPNLSIKRDSPERRKSFRARHKCDKPEGKNRCTARYWSCYQWRAGARVKSEE